MISEKEVLELFKSNPNLGLKLLHKSYADLCFSVSMRYLNNNEEAEEIVMNTFLKAYNKLDGFEWTFEGSLKAWLKKITINESLMQLRRRKMKFEAMDDLQNNSTFVLPLDRLEYKEIIKLFDLLPLHQRTVFQLFEIDGFSHREISEMLGISIGTSKSNLNRAKCKLKDKLSVLGYKN
jgi:RNA polymerase sigma factor (sigma-70 family)